MPTAKADNHTKLKLLRLMLESRLSDEAEQAIKRRGQGHFQLSAEGHEALVGIAVAMGPQDWFHPHYRDRAIVMGRGVSIEELFLDFYSKAGSLTAGRQMPVHFNSKRHRIAARSSPVANNLLQSVGMAMSLQERGVQEVVVASIGDASTREGEVSEAFAQAAIDKLPVVFLIADNGYGISTPTTGKTFWTMPHALSENGSEQWFYGCRVEQVDGLDPVAVYEISAAAIERARNGGGPTIVIAKVVRSKSHSSSDDHRVYRSKEDLKTLLLTDPVRKFADRCVAEKLISETELESLHGVIQSEIRAALQRAQKAPDPEATSAHLENTAFAPLPEGLPERDQNQPAFLAKDAGGQTMAQCIATVFEQELRQNGRLCIYGEDIEDPKGDVFGTTRGLSSAFPGRVRNSPLAEATIMGTCVGRAMLGDLPVAAIQFIDFLGPGWNQLQNEVTTTYWRSNGQWNSPVVVMAPYGAYLPGLGPWHSQSSEALYAHLPGLHVVIPSNAADAAGLLRYSLRCNRPVLFLYPKALLHSAEETVAEPAPNCMVPFGLAQTVRPGRDVTLVTWGNGVPLCKNAALEAAKEGIEAEVIDLRSIVPWDVQAVQASVERTGRLVVVHEDNKTCGFGAEVLAEIVPLAFESLRAKPERVVKSDDHIPYNHALEMALLPSVERVLAALRRQSKQDLRPGRNVVDTTVGIGIGASAAKASGGRRELEPESVGTIDVMTPRQSPTDEDATVVRFHVKIGQHVKAGTPLVEMEANKGSFEVEAPSDGIVAKFHAAEGERVRVETPLITLDLDTGAAVAPKAPEPQQKEIALSPAQMQVGALALKSQSEIPTVSVECEVDMTRIARQREALKDEFETKAGLRPTYTHLLLWAISRAMQTDRHQGFRGHLSPAHDKLLVDDAVNIGFAAVGPHENLYSPVVRNAEKLTLIELCQKVQELTDHVRKGEIHAAELQGATVTLTNIGAFEATSGTPFIIPGQLAMFAAGSMLKRPRFVEGSNGAVEPRLLLNLKLVFDHRPFNGSHSASFLRTIKHSLENLDLAKLLAESLK